MKFLSLSRYAFALVCATLLGSCGGGGAGQGTLPPGPDVFPIAIQPASATWYAGVKNTLSIVGSAGPFTLSSSDPGILPVPTTTTARFIDIVPLQPGVVDAGLDPNELQVRTVIITVRSADGQTATASIAVAQNFLTGYGMFFTNSTCPIPASGSAFPCAGGETTIVFDSTFNGAVYAGHQFRITRIRGPFQFVDPLNSNNQVDQVTVTADHEGKFTTVIRVAAGTPTQDALIQVTDVQTGATVIRSLIINGTPATSALTLLPATISLTGPNATQCGFGTVDVLVFDGRPPYTAVCPNPQIQVVTPSSNTDPGRITFNVGASTFCLAGEQCVITDSTGARQTITITTQRGTSPPVTNVQVSPNTITLGCGATGAVTVAGGLGNYQVNSTHPRVQASVSGNTVTITRLTGDPAIGSPFQPTATISVTDGSSIANVTANVPPACP